MGICDTVVGVTVDGDVCGGLAALHVATLVWVAVRVVVFGAGGEPTSCHDFDCISDSILLAFNGAIGADPRGAVTDTLCKRSV